ncbi:S1 family peptidase [Streptomyces sp. NBC_00162]|uniref:S1 family peptidase n=1 Tax=Streptomyces sp. NBC_00162 TaxID=2903629 RepID=UPI00214B2F1C|nr:serine protease [Streptomyces sp. NBC_00162]UUU37732.1 serine protease [Streptomyces sp. NBC_00162]
MRERRCAASLPALVAIAPLFVIIALLGNPAETVPVGSEYARISHATQLSLQPTPTPIPVHSSPTLGDIEREILDVKGVVREKRKDAWDKLFSVSGIIAGFLVASIGAVATYVLAKRQREQDRKKSDRELMVQRVATVEPLIKLLGSGSEREKEASLLAIDALGDPDLASKLAAIFGGEGSAAALSRIAAQSSGEIAAGAERSLESVFHTLKASVVTLVVGGMSVASGFVVAPGYILTALHAVEFGGVGFGKSLHVKAHDQSIIEAAIHKTNRDKDLALLQVEDSRLPALRIETRPERLVSFEEVAVVTPHAVRVGRIDAIELTGVANLPGQATMISARLEPEPGSSGAPGVNGGGRVVGMVVGADDKGGAFLTSATEIMSFLQTVKVNNAGYLSVGE